MMTGGLANKSHEVIFPDEWWQSMIKQKTYDDRRGWALWCAGGLWSAYFQQRKMRMKKWCERWRKVWKSRRGPGNLKKKKRWNKKKLAPGGFFPKWRFYLGGFYTWPFQGWKVTWSKPSRDQKVKEAGGKDSGWFWRCLKLPAWQGCWKVSKVLGSGMIRFRRVPIKFQQFQETNGWRARQKLEFCGVDGSYMNFVSNILPSAVRHGTWTYFERNHYDEGHLYLYSYGHRTPRCWKSTKKG